MEVPLGLRFWSMNVRSEYKEIILRLVQESSFCIFPHSEIEDRKQIDVENRKEGGGGGGRLHRSRISNRTT